MLRLWLQRVLDTFNQPAYITQRALGCGRSLTCLVGWVLIVVLSGCANVPSSTNGSVPSSLPAAAQTNDVDLTPAAPSHTLSIERSVTPTVTIMPTKSPVPSSTPTTTPSFTPTSTVTPLPTYTKLRGKVTIAQAVCHYGPGAPYLYKYGVYAGSNLEILRRVEGGNYIEIQAIGGNNPCWVRVDYMEIRGDVNALEPVHPFDVQLPMSPYYAPPAWVKAVRQGDMVTVEWAGLSLRAGDDSEQTPYIVEAWVCQEGRMVFQPIGSYFTQVTIQDEPGCGQVSRARLLAAEKHGYTRPLEIDWPQPVLLTPLP